MGWTELHKICYEERPSVEHFGFLLNYLAVEEHQDEAKEQDKDGRTPMHLLLRHHPPLNVMTALLDAYPDVVYVQEYLKGYYPVHTACRAGNDVRVVRLLLERNPEALNLRSKRAFCCLHGFTAMDMVKKLPEDHPDRDPLVILLQEYEWAFIE
mmetsp:Transcript_20049/g.29490  ORF Transcript_20049/g.29490 Transcript_20049/m.29490 type:complete len:154 (+) Transcript_20049:171-632(+)|eukprot:CAMPEP_0195515504 /NCGR_PEP_ID=MMETSP0794_2-20130614/6548_1 /TAXON_ID=515487 /ORGANISM="Stephanopyxis turris, Strain CCMP 815" /LENGTH=153 /DNA_ID=CAMNT_0040643933 /DNA_START=79 /DNA_END=540 /DNA_ORIENTATION=+